MCRKAQTPFLTFELEKNPKMSPSVFDRIKQGLKCITVEPTMFLYMFAFQLTSVLEQALFIQKACLANHNYTTEICDNLNEYKEIKVEVQHTVSTFLQWNNIAGHVFPIVIALFIGSWSDRRGRKIPLIIGLIGKLIYTLGILLNIHFANWPVESIIYTATIPSAATGTDVVIFASAFAYISDVTSVENRTVRITILDVCYLVTFPIGIALGAYLFEYVVNRSYMIMFGLNATFLVAAIIYTALNLDYLTSPAQRSVREVGCCGIFGDFFDKQHVFDSLKTLSMFRPSHRHLYLWTLLTAMFFYTFQRDERSYTYLYTQYEFNWETEQFSQFKVFQSTSYILMLFTGMPIMTKLLKWQDTTIAMIGAINFALARIFYAFAQVPWVFYVGAFISCVGPVGGPIIRSMTSKVVPAAERGKVFALLAVCDNAVPLVSGTLYTQIYNLTLKKHIFNGAIFWLTAITQSVLFVLMLIIHISLNGQSLATQETENMPSSNDLPDVIGPEKTIIPGNSSDDFRVQTS